jgi:hypothetical protein
MPPMIDHSIPGSLKAARAGREISPAGHWASM